MEPLEILSFQVVENPNNPLSVWVRFETSRPAVARVEVLERDGPHPEQVVVVEEGAAPSVSHEVAVVGLHAGLIVDYQAVAEAEDGASAMAGGQRQTGALPPDLPPVTAEVDGTGEPGWTVCNVTRWLGAGFDPGWGYILGFDAAGHVIYAQPRAQAGDIKLSAQGTWLVQVGEDAIAELSIMGAERNLWLREDLQDPVDSMHHEVWEDGAGDLWTLSTELRTIDGYDDGNGGTTSYDVVGDVVVHFGRDGTVQRTWSMFDILGDHVLRVRQDFHLPFWDNLYQQQAPGGTKDWTHGNALVVDEAGGRALVSLRHQDWIVAFDLDTGARQWLLGPEGDFTLTAGEWFWHQHAPMWIPDGRILIYDNGNDRPGGGGEAPYSRAVMFTLDEQAMTAAQVWEHRFSQAPDFAPFLGDADLLPEGNVLVTDGGLVQDPQQLPFNPANVKLARIYEVTPAGEEVAVWTIGGPDAGTSFSVYRAERIDGGLDLAQRAGGG